MRTYHLDTADKAPLYEQLYRAIRHDIMHGILTGGERLPSKRRLAEHLKISQITVETAYSQLLAEGYILSRPRSGYFVQQFEHCAPVPEMPEISEKNTGKNAAKTPEKPSFSVTKPVVFDFKTNTVDTDCFPFSTWARMLRGELTSRASQLLAAVPPQGALELRTEICRYLAEFRSIQAQPDQIVVGAGSEYLLNLIIQLLGRDRIYSVENPGYPRFYRTFQVLGAPVVPVTLDQYGLRTDLLRQSGASAVYLTPSHHFPLGVVMPAARRMEVVQWALESDDRYIIEDDYDSEFRYASRPIPAMKELDHADRVIYLNSFAKTLAPSLRISYMVLPRRLMSDYQNRLGFYASTVPSFEQYTLAQFLRTGSFERHIARIRNLYKNRRNALLHALAGSPLYPDLKISGAEAGLHLLVTLKTGMDEQTMIANAEKCGARVIGLSGYYLTAPELCPPSTVLLGYAGMPETQFPKAADALTHAWNRA